MHAMSQVTPAMEDYLKAVYSIKSAGQIVTIRRMSEALQVSSPSVTKMVKRLESLQLIRHAPYACVDLTPAGEQVALLVLRHQSLLTRYLTETLGMSRDQAGRDADRLEHVVSVELETRLTAALERSGAAR